MTMKLPLRAALALALLLALQRPASAQSWTLVDAVREALDHHPAIAEADARAAAAEAGRGVARAQWLPSLSASSSAVRFAEPMVVAPLHGFDPTHPPTFDDALVRNQLGLSYTLFDGGGRAAANDAASAQLDAAEAGRDVTSVEVIQATVNAFGAVRTAVAVLDASQRRRTALQAEVDRAERLLEAGAAAEVETLRARAALAQADADHASAEANLGAARTVLGRLTGREQAPLPAGSPDRITASLSGSPSTEAVPEVAVAEARVAAADARKRAVRSSFLPRISLASSVDQYGATGRSFTNEWQAGVQVSLPLFLGGARFAESRQRTAEAAEARAALERVRLELATRRDQTLSAVAEAEGRVTALTAAEAQFVEVARVEALALAEGSGVQRDLLAAEASLFVVRADLARAHTALLSARVALARLDGELSADWLAAHLETSR